jgi:Leucine-rich repeat (LRR) protein
LAKQTLKVFEVYGTQIDKLRPFIFGFSNALEVLNLSYSNIADMFGELPNVEDFARIKTLDLSFVVFPMLALQFPVGKLELTNHHFENFRVNFPDSFMLFLAPQTVNISGTVPKMVNSLWIKHCTASLKEDTGVHVQHLILKENNLKYLDLHMDCEKVSLNSVISLDFSVNGLQFLHPSVLSCMPNMTHLDLSKNELNVMASIDYRQFEDIFMGLVYLQEINLSGNNLITTPRNLFQNNHNLEYIDLSNNGLTQITFTLEHAYRLHTLLLHNNHIQVLDSKSISSLTNVPIAPMSREITTNITVTFYNNPLRCSQCENKPFLQWILTLEHVNAKHENLACYATESVILDMDNAVIDHVEAICQRERVIIATTVSVATFLLFILAIVIVKCLRKRHNERKNNIEKVIRLLKQGKNQYEFAVFLSYSSADDEFVRTCVFNRLRDILKEITGIDRTLICEGDHNLRPGFYVLEETILCIQRSAVVIVVVSDRFCHSNYCDTELLQAYDLKKPILLILKGKVEESSMRPVMKLLFQQNVRVLFEENNGAYILKNTWEHVGKSIIDLIVQNL